MSRIKDLKHSPIKTIKVYDFNGCIKCVYHLDNHGKLIVSEHIIGNNQIVEPILPINLMPRFQMQSQPYNVPVVPKPNINFNNINNLPLIKENKENDFLFTDFNFNFDNFATINESEFNFYNF